MGTNRSKSRKIKLTPVSTLHYVRLVYRSALFLWLLVDYIAYRLHYSTEITQRLESRPLVWVVVWGVFVVEMTLRFFPSRLESPGCQKQFARNYIKSGSTDIVIHDNNAVMLVALIWICFNAFFGALHMAGILDDGIMILLASAYSVCDMICILFFCPFQSWFLKNKCCSTCRIYNWDYAMMFTPLFFIPRHYSWSLLLLSVALLVRWEITFYRHPERFSENTNNYLRCQNCTEKLCTHKKQLHSLWKQIEIYTAERIKFLSLTPSTSTPKEAAPKDSPHTMHHDAS
ncbi:MAG: hypothetical protein IJ794_11270 [Lachnospiraceae bacterium]|nr:hypothetical protein [Lachnospiraceae bacterium]